jgi:predicted MFS family arabinose efflux permease
LSADYVGHWAPFALLAVLFAASTWMLVPLRKELETSAPRATNKISVAGLLREFTRVFEEPWARRVLVTVFLEGACVMGAFAYFATHLHRALGISFTLAGSAATLFGVGGLLFATSARRLLSRMGESGLIVGGGALLLVMMSLVAIAPSTAVAAAACFATGMGFYMFHSTLQTHATQMAPTRRGAAVAAFALCYFLGQSAGVSLAGWGVTHFGAAPVITTAAIGVMLTALAFARSRSRHH